jgi:DNA-binding transcriptional LysR family regulator
MSKTPELVDLVVLARVVDRLSFARAAVDLGVPASTLSRRIAALERRLGVRLLERTTRMVRPTDVGRLLAERGARVREELEQAERVVADHQRAPRGVLRLTVPTPIADDFIGPAIAEYVRRYPEMRVETIAENRMVDLVREGFDAALRVAQLPDSSLGSVRLAVVGPVLAGSPRYLDRAPPLRHPRDLANHTTLAFGRKRTQRWRFLGRAGAVATVTVQPRATANSAPMVADMVAAGVGLATLPRFVAQLKQLAIVEPGGYRPVPVDLSIVTPSARATPPKVRAFVDLMREFVAARPDMFDYVIPRRNVAHGP